MQMTKKMLVFGEIAKGYSFENLDEDKKYYYIDEKSENNIFVKKYGKNLYFLSLFDLFNSYKIAGGDGKKLLNIHSYPKKYNIK